MACIGGRRRENPWQGYCVCTDAEQWRPLVFSSFVDERAFQGSFCHFRGLMRQWTGHACAIEWELSRGGQAGQDEMRLHVDKMDDDGL